MPHLVEVTRLVQSLLHPLHCDHWYVACRTGDQTIARLASAGSERYALAFQCRPDVEKAVYHGSRAWKVSVIPLKPDFNLDEVELHAVMAAISGHKPDDVAPPGDCEHGAASPPARG